ncbi:MAG: hypothetical protein R3300_06030 [Candidatus Promineifilaceae bacterium]|nr:hypothetical protein [Candidatus Promineifilaceae bacterium]
MTEAQILTPDERLDDRPFTNPAHSRDDLAFMRKMARQLLEAYTDPLVCDFRPGQRPVCESDPQGRHFRIYYIQPELLFSSKGLTVVGFFGHKRPGADVKPLIAADKRFEEVFHEHAGLLSLSTVRLPNGDFGNLVLFTDPEAKDHWNRMPLHYDTVSRISPPYYEHIRLNNGYLPDGLDAPEELQLLRVRYIDYNESPAWRAVREFESTPDSQDAAD